GRYAEARSEFERFIEESPKDPRAPWASFESGRLAMDHLEDFTGASMSIERAVKMAPGAPFVPDALARQITLLEIAGRYESCFLVKRRYLENYPDGAHVPEVSSACKK
ncbi:MAG: tetratricopeptide repeat protein, partial [Myxococcota bacterium]